MRIVWDGDGYPTEESLSGFAEYDDKIGWTKWAVLVAALPDIMEGCPCATVTSQWIKDDLGKWELEIEFHTGGWSGAESVISKVINNRAIKMLYHERWERGGHFWFRIPESQLRGTLYARQEAPNA